MKFKVFFLGLILAGIAPYAFSQDVTPTILVQPVSWTNVLGDAFEFDITSDNDITYDFIWRLNNAAIPNTDLNPTYLVSASSPSDAGTYDCVVTNPGTGLSVTSTPVVLTIWNPPVISQQPTNILAIMGDDVTFTVQMSPLIPTNFTYQWLNENVAMSDGSSGYGSTNYGTATASLTISNVQSADAGNYAVDVNNDIQNLTNSGVFDTLSSNVTLTVIVPPIIINQPNSDTNAYQGDYVLFSVGIDPSTTDDPANGYPLTYQWYKNGINIAGATDWSYELDSVDTPNNGNYYAVIQNYGGSVTSAVAVLTVYDPPVITVQPLAYQLVATNTTVKLSVTATGTALSYQWYEGNNPIAGATNATYSFFAASTNQSDTFSVYVYNVVDSVFSADAVVEIRPTIRLPFVSWVLPAEGTRLSNSIVSLNGQVDITANAAASGSVLSSVQIQNNGGPPTNSSFTYHNTVVPYVYYWWTNTQSLIPGTNTFLLTAVDNYGNQGGTIQGGTFYSCHLVYVVPSPLTLVVSGPGTVSSNWSGGNLLEIGRSYSLTATPSSSFKFLNWSGGVSSTNPVLNFLMQSNLVVQANFVTTNPPAPTINLKLTNSQAWISFTSSIGATYTLQYKNALTDPAWGSLPSLFSGTGNLLTLTDRLSSPPTRLYRLQAVGTNGVIVTPPIIQLNLTNSQARISFTSQSNVTYTLSFKNTFGDSSWGILPGPTNGNGGTITLIDSTLPAATRFYRLQSTSP